MRGTVATLARLGSIGVALPALPLVLLPPPPAGGVPGAGNGHGKEPPEGAGAGVPGAGLEVVPGLGRGGDEVPGLGGGDDGGGGDEGGGYDGGGLP
jgi:hypothetical protein